MGNWNWPVVIGVIIALIVGVFVGLIFAPKEVGSTYEEVQTYANEQVALAVAPLNEKISELEQQIMDLQAEEEEEIEEVKLGYPINDLFLGELYPQKVFSDREVIALFDGKVEFDGDDYDAEEKLTLEKFVLRANDNDFKGIPYLIVPEGAIKFELVFDDDLNTSLITDEETLTFILFGEEVEVSSWDGTEITFTKGKEVFLEQGESVTVDKKRVVLDMVLDGAVYVLVDGVGGKIVEDKTKTINGVEIKVKEVLYSGYSGGYAKATLIIGEEVEVTVSNGDEYEEDSIWEWIIGSNSIGLILVEEFTELDEEFSALAKGDKICLPNEYVCVLFNGMVEEDSEEYTFELDKKGELTYVEARGNFQSGIDDYSRIYINATGIYDKDLKLINNESIELGDTELKLVIGKKFIRIENSEFVKEFRMNYNLNVTDANNMTDVLTNEEDNFLTDYGILVKNPEDSCKDQEFRITVPKERLEASVSLI